jgi:putative endonuclease
MYYVYIIKSKKDGDLYIGSTGDVLKRLSEHNSGKVFSTKNRTPFSLIYYEAYTSVDDARDREKSFKSSGSVYMGLKKRIIRSLKMGD